MTKHLLTAALLFAGAGATSEYFHELSDPLFDYCQKVEASELLHNELGFLFERCEASRSDDLRAAEAAIAPAQYLKSLRELDMAHHKSLWELHLLLRSAIESDDVGLFEKIAALEERKLFEMNGLLPHALAFIERHHLERPYYINPNVKAGAFQHDWQ